MHRQTVYMYRQSADQVSKSRRISVRRLTAVQLQLLELTGRFLDDLLQNGNVDVCVVISIDRSINDCCETSVATSNATIYSFFLFLLKNVHQLA